MPRKMPVLKYLAFERVESSGIALTSRAKLDGYGALDGQAGHADNRLF
jgi:hypothetical protein